MNMCPKCGTELRAENVDETTVIVCEPCRLVFAEGRDEATRRALQKYISPIAPSSQPTPLVRVTEWTGTWWDRSDSLDIDLGIDHDDANRRGRWHVTCTFTPSDEEPK